MIAATNPIPHRNITRDSASCRRLSMCQAPVAMKHMPVVRKAASSMCGQRMRTIGPVVIAHQSSGTILPSTKAWPSGTCIHELLHRIQNEENMVPSETMQQEKK